MNYRMYDECSTYERSTYRGGLGAQNGVKRQGKITSRAGLGASLALVGAPCVRFDRSLARLACFPALSRAIPGDLGTLVPLLDHIFMDLVWIFGALSTLRIELPSAREAHILAKVWFYHSPVVGGRAPPRDSLGLPFRALGRGSYSCSSSWRILRLSPMEPGMVPMNASIQDTAPVRPGMPSAATIPRGVAPL